MGTVILWTVGIIAALALGFGALVGEGWLIFLVYNAIAPESWPYLNLWPAVGIAFLLSLFLGGSSVRVKTF